jgi:hypothetical protein
MTAAWGWLLWGLGNVALIVPLDLWLHFTHRHTLTRQMHDWIYLTPAAQFIIPGAIALVAWFVVHEITYHPHG